MTARARPSLVLAACVLAATLAPPAHAGQAGTGARAEHLRELIAAGDYVGAEALARADAADARTRHGAGSVEEAEALDGLTEALIVNGRAASAEAQAIAERAVTVRTVRNGGGDAGASVALAHRAEIASTAADFSRAMTLAGRAVAAAEASSGPDSLDTARALDHLGAVLNAAERFDRAQGALERSLRLKEALAAPEGELAATLEELGLMWQSRGDYRRSAEVLRRAYEARDAGRAGHPAAIRTLNLTAEQQWFDGDLAASRATSERAVTLARQVLRPEHPMLAFSLRSLAATLSDLGEVDRSLALKQEALAIAEQSYGPAHPATAPYVHSLGLSALDKGDYAVSRDHFQRALAIYAASYGPRHQLVATAHSVLALADARLGDFASAVRHQATAVRIHEAIGGASHPFVAVALTALASIRLEQGMPITARHLLERALVIRETRFGLTHRDVAITLADLATALMRSRQAARAERLAARAVSIWANLGVPDAPEFATVLVIAAQLRAGRGDAPAAAALYERALAIRARAFGTTHPLYGEAMAGLAATLLARGHSAAALEAAAASETIGREHLRVMLRTLPERQALNYAAARPRGLDVLLQLATSSSGAAATAFDAVIRSRALILDEMAARLRDAHDAGRDGSAALATYAAAQQRLAGLLVKGQGNLSPADYGALVARARDDTELAEQALAQSSVEFARRRARASVGLDEVRAALPDATALLSFVRYRRRTSMAPQAGGGGEVDTYLALVLGAGQPVTAVDLGPASRAEAVIAAWRRDLLSLGPGGEARARLTGGAVRRAVWDPVAPALGSARQVLIVPDGLLSLVPFAALPTEPRRYLIDAGPVLHYLSAERDVTATPQRPQGQGLLALGGAAFDERTSPALPMQRRGSDGCIDLPSTVFQPLAGTQLEVRDIGALWTAAMGAEAVAEILVGARASEQSFKRQAPGVRVLHVATHGFFLGRSCQPAGRGTRGVGGLAPARTVNDDNPLALSGLALAGANRRAQARANEDDGILTAEEVAALPLDGVEWAVLSACDTGVGGIRAGEGVFGLRRAFHLAGARTVILSLWSVDDRATRRWMRALYEARFQRQRSTADATHEAGLTVLRERRASGRSTHPFYWAAFVAAGEWR